MTRAEIEFLRSAGFSIAEIMGMYPVQNDEKPAEQPAGSAPSERQNVQTEEQIPLTAPEQPEQPAPAQTAAGDQSAASPAGDQSAAILAKLDKLISAIQAGNRAGATMPTPTKESPEEIAGKLY